LEVKTQVAFSQTLEGEHLKSGGHCIGQFGLEESTTTLQQPPVQVEVLHCLFSMFVRPWNQEMQLR